MKNFYNQSWFWLIVVPMLLATWMAYANIYMAAGMLLFALFMAGGLFCKWWIKSF
jgi:hypothetical protein